MAEGISLLAAFLGGVMWFFSPCILPVIPSYIAQILGVSWERINEHPLEYRGIFLTRGFLFILGFSLVFIILGAGASSLGVFLNDKIPLLQKIGGGFIIIFGLLVIFQEFIRSRLLGKKILFNTGGPFLLGVSFSTGITICTTPVLASILILASLQASFFRGIILLIFFSLGLSVPFLLIPIILGRLTTFLKRISKYLIYVQAASGVLLILLGILVYRGYLSVIAAKLTKF